MNKLGRVIGITAMVSFAVNANSKSSLIPEEFEPDFQVIVVGSGYGGSVAVFNLAERGIQTLVLEKGRHWIVEDPTTNATFATVDSIFGTGDSRSMWLDDNCSGGNPYLTPRFLPDVPCATVNTGILENVDDVPNLYDHSPKLASHGVRSLVGIGVGGGSLINNGITFRPSKLGWDAAYPQGELPHMQRLWKDLQPYFDIVEERLGATPIPEDILTSDYYSATRTMLEITGAAGYPLDGSGDPDLELWGRGTPPTIANWDLVREEMTGVRTPAFITGETWYGNNSGAKLSLNTEDAYLGRALATGNVDLRPLHTVSEITYDKRKRLYVVSVVETDEAYNIMQTMQFTTRHLILSAGSFGTTKLLVRAKERGDLPKLNKELGTRWSNNGFTVHWRFFNDRTITQGGPSGAKIHDNRELGNPVVLENLPIPTPSVFNNIPQLSNFLNSLFTIGIGVPSQTGTFSYDAETDTVELDWPAGAAQNVYDRVETLFTNPELPGTPLIVPVELSQSTTPHPLGGVPYGLATNKHCELKGYPGLYAIDGSLIPGAAAVANPSFLISAIAEYCMATIGDDIEKGRGGAGSSDTATLLVLFFSTLGVYYYRKRQPVTKN